MTVINKIVFAPSHVLDFKTQKVDKSIKLVTTSIFQMQNTPVSFPSVKMYGQKKYSSLGGDPNSHPLKNKIHINIILKKIFFPAPFEAVNKF